MDFDETMVENEFEDAAEDDALPEGIVEEEDESEESLESIIEDDGQDAEDDAEKKPEEQPVKQATEPGWIKKRVNDAVEKAVARTRAEMQAMFDAQMAPIREKMIEDEAQALVRERKVADIETARELVRLRNGQPAAPRTEPQQGQQPRNERGQFVSNRQDDDPATTARIDMLKHQAEQIKGEGGPDVIAEFNNNEKVKRAIIDGTMDFYDVARQMRNVRKKPPSPVRSSNGASGANPNAIESMSDEAFARLEKRIQGGARIRMN